MKKAYKKIRVIENINLGPDIYRMKVQASCKPQAGQFFMLRIDGWDMLLARPLSVYDCGENSLSFLYKTVGKGTERLSRLAEGDQVMLMGPLGRGFKEEQGRICIIGGGIGIAPLLYLARRLKDQNPHIYLGFKDQPYELEEFKKYGKLTVASESLAGYKTGYIVDYIDYDAYDIFYVCGPQAMIAYLKDRLKSKKAYFSLEARMACGLGACLGCSIETRDGMKRVCVDGPVFEGDRL